MADKSAEALCGLMDGELGVSEARFLIRRLGHDRDLSARWERYHLARSAVSRNLATNLDGFAARVSQALEGESVGRVPITRRVGWLKPLGGAAVAASVALLVFNVWRQPVVPSDALERQAPSLAVASVAERGIGAPLATPASAQIPSGRWNPRLQGYLVRHNEATAPRRSQGLVPYWYLVSEPPPEVMPEEEADRSQAPAAE